mmetsp:Transcript_72622/g.142213  ORF Transcript_72622/g.142213 Transcript_72622/m.142213 type:complete len:351 (+) Transcript_72622:180-1232(+)
MIGMLQRAKRKGGREEEGDNPLSPSSDEFSEAMKKIRVSVHPGEIRLKRDLDESQFKKISDLHNITWRIVGHQPIVIQIHIGVLFPKQDFQGCNALAKLETEHFPKEFTFVVPRFYPHDAPLVYLMESPTSWALRQPWAEALDKRYTDGRLFHPLLMKDWSATWGFTQAVHSFIQASQHLLTQPQAPQEWQAKPSDQTSARLIMNESREGGGGGGGGREGGEYLREDDDGDGVGLNRVPIEGAMDQEHPEPTQPQSQFQHQKQQDVFLGSPPLVGQPAVIGRLEGLGGSVHSGGVGAENEYGTGYTGSGGVFRTPLTTNMPGISFAACPTTEIAPTSSTTTASGNGGGCI